jgi:hypothetical protein
MDGSALILWKPGSQEFTILALFQTTFYFHFQNPGIEVKTVTTWLPYSTEKEKNP